MNKLFVCTFCVMMVSSPTVASANCDSDLAVLLKARGAAIRIVATVVATAAAQGKQVNAAEYCAKSAGLETVENTLLEFMKGNRAACKIPVAVFDDFRATHTKFLAMRDKACAIARRGT
jgi:phage-related minor tail protein